MTQLEYYRLCDRERYFCPINGVRSGYDYDVNLRVTYVFCGTHTSKEVSAPDVPDGLHAQVLYDVNS
jgi:hypothetical protein